MLRNFVTKRNNDNLTDVSSSKVEIATIENKLLLHILERDNQSFTMITKQPGKMLRECDHKHVEIRQQALYVYQRVKNSRMVKRILKQEGMCQPLLKMLAHVTVCQE